MVIFGFSSEGKRPWTGLATVLIVTWAFQVHVNRRDWSELGFSPNLPGILRGIAGLLFGATLFSVIVVLLAMTGSVHLSWNGGPPGDLLTILAVMALLEELLSRGYPLLTFTRAIGPRAALGFTSLFFALLHGANPGFGILPLASVFLAGLVMGAIFLRWGLWTSWGFHFAWNMAQGYLFGLPISGAPDSLLKVTPLLKGQLAGPVWWTGGIFGVEGSLLTVIALGGAAWFLINFRDWPSLEESWKARIPIEEAEGTPGGPVDVQLNNQP